ncbi:GNAT family protein [Microbacterium awajiense]|uniref:GNAT family protein n=1 Tax=Microbacterium awajiense TaxID=415214 RepID=A0ABP7AHT8_9MICO
MTTLSRTLVTERLTLRPGTAADADTTWGYRRLDSVNEWLSGPPADLDGYRETFREPTRLAETVVVELLPELGGGLVGDLMLRVGDAWAQTLVVEQARGRQVELGWALDPAHTGHGYASEAVAALIDYCFDELAVHRIVAECFLANESSWRLMERVGMRRESHTRDDALHRSGRWLDSVGYAVLRREHRAR